MIRLPATPKEYLLQVVVPALSIIRPAALSTPAAQLQLVATALQESALRHRWQIVDAAKPETKGPARGLLQFERGGGVRGVMRHSATKANAQLICTTRRVEFEETAIWRAMETDDILCAAFGRQLLLADPSPLPAVGNVNDAFYCYVRCWRPGAYDRGTDAERANLRRKWFGNYAQALKAVTEP